MLKKRPLSAYQLGAGLFWGSSKVFQGKERWLMDLFNKTYDSWLDENAFFFIKEKGLFVDQEVIG